MAGAADESHLLTVMRLVVVKKEDESTSSDESI